MRILLISEFDQSSTTAVAAGTRISAIRDFLVAKGWDVLLVVPIQDGATSPRRISGQAESLTTYETRRQRLHSPIAAIFVPADLIAYTGCFRKFLPDIVMISAYSPVLLVEPLIVARVLSIPVVFDVLDSWILLSAFHPGRFRNWLRRRAEQYALSHGDLVVGVTQSQVNLLKRTYRLESAKTITVPRGIDVNYKSAGSAIPEYDLIHVGPPRDYYDTQGLLDGLSLLAHFRPNLRVAYLGIEDGPGKSRLQDDLAQRGLSSKVDLVSPVPRSEVVLWTMKARAGLISLTAHEAYRAAISTKAYDYVAAGIPILYLGPADSEQGDFIRKFGIGQIAETTAQFAKQADRLLGDPATLREMSLRALATARLMQWTVLLEPLRERLISLSESKPVQKR